MISRMQIN